MTEPVPKRFIRRKLEQLKPYCSVIKLNNEGICVASCPRFQEYLEQGICPAELDYWASRQKEKLVKQKSKH